MFKGFFLVFFLSSINVFALGSATGSFGGSGIGSFRGFAGAMGIGFGEFTVLSPAANFRMNQGLFAHLAGEREISESGLFVTLSFNYMKSNGESFYDYSTLGGTRFTGTDIGFSTSNYQLGLGLKLKFFRSSWFRPYAEAGGLFGYHELQYSLSTTTITQTGTGGSWKDTDGLTGFGYYGEAGVEIDFSEEYGVKLSGKYGITETRPFATLAGEKVKYEARAFQIAILKKF